MTVPKKVQIGVLVQDLIKWIYRWHNRYSENYYVCRKLLRLSPNDVIKWFCGLYRPSYYTHIFRMENRESTSTETLEMDEDPPKT